MLFGASGWMMLDIYGDRKAADADLYTVVKGDSTYNWQWAGTYEYIKDSVSWL